MGWTYTNKFSNESVQEFFQREFWGQSGRCEIIASCLKNFRVFYAAVKTVETGEVWALVCLVDLKPYRGYTIGYKDMDETMGPYQRDCPERIMKLLTPLENKDSYAGEWRAACWENIKKRKEAPKVNDGDTIKFSAPIKFTNGLEHDTFKVSKKGNRVLFRAGYTTYRITNWRKREFEIV